MPIISIEKQKLLTADQLRDRLHYEPNTGIFYRVKPVGGWSIGTKVGTKNGRGRYVIKIDLVSFYASRLAWLYMTGEWPNGEIDHIDNDKMNDRWANLRLATHIENSQNRQYGRGAIGVRGVCRSFNGDKFRARIIVDRKSLSLGVFDTLDEAIAARRSAELRYFGQFAPLIPPSAKTEA